VRGYRHEKLRNCDETGYYKFPHTAIFSSIFLFFHRKYSDECPLLLKGQYIEGILEKTKLFSGTPSMNYCHFKKGEYSSEYFCGKTEEYWKTRSVGGFIITFRFRCITISFLPTTHVLFFPFLMLFGCCGAPVKRLIFFQPCLAA